MTNQGLKKDIIKKDLKRRFSFMLAGCMYVFF